MTSIVDLFNRNVRKIPTWVVYLSLALPIFLLFYWAVNGQLGPDPINRLERDVGEIALQLIIASLVITPARRFLNINLIKFRRAIGVMAFVYVAVHLGIWVVLDMSLLFAQMWEDIWKRPYITVGMVACLAMIPLAATSNDWSVRKMGAASWRKLHKLAYPIAVLGAVHFIMVQKVWEREPMIYLAIIVVLIGLRYIPKQKATGMKARR